ncbi:MAG: DoxX family protein [Myxococcales bacterium]
MNIAVWIATVLVAGLFLFAGAPKIAGKMAEQFGQLGYPAWFSYFIGAVEIGGALLLLVPRTATVGGALLAATMVGAIATLAKNHHAADSPPAVICLVLAAFVAWERRDRLFGPRRAAPGALQGGESPRSR